VRTTTLDTTSAIDNPDELRKIAVAADPCPFTAAAPGDVAYLRIS